MRFKKSNCRKKMVFSQPDVLRLAFSGVAQIPSHYKYNKTFHSAADFPQENPEVAIEANRCWWQLYYFSSFFIKSSIKLSIFSPYIFIAFS